MYVAHSRYPDAVRRIRKLGLKVLYGLGISLLAATCLVLIIYRNRIGLPSSMVGFIAVLMAASGICFFVIAELARESLSSDLKNGLVVKVDRAIFRRYRTLTKKYGTNWSNDDLFAFQDAIRFTAIAWCETYRERWSK